MSEADETSKKPRAKSAAKDGDDSGDRGPLTPVQYEDDGWAGIPIQMRG